MIIENSIFRAERPTVRSGSQSDSTCHHVRKQTLFKFPSCRNAILVEVLDGTINMFFHSVMDHIAVVLVEAIPGHVSGMAGDASDASALEHGSGAGSGGGEVVEAEPFALAVTSAADFAVGADYHGVAG